MTPPDAGFDEAPTGEAPIGEAPERDRGPEPSAEQGSHAPLYGRVLRLRHVRLARWQAVLLFDGVLVTGALLALAEVVSAWAPVVLPVAVAVVVKAYDVVAGLAGPLPPVH